MIFACTAKKCVVSYNYMCMRHVIEVRGNYYIAKYFLSDFHYVNGEIEDFFRNKRLSERLSFTRFCANGNRPVFIRGGSERDETAVK